MESTVVSASMITSKPANGDRFKPGQRPTQNIGCSTMPLDLPTGGSNSVSMSGQSGGVPVRGEVLGELKEEGCSGFTRG